MKTNNILKNLIYSILTFLSVYCYINKYIEKTSLIIILYFILIILLFFFYYKFDRNIVLEKKYKIFTIIMSFIFTLFYSYEIKGTGELFLSDIILSVLKILGHYLFYKTVIYYLIKFLKKEYICNNKIIKKYSEHPFIYSFIFLSICYSVYLIIYYPAILNYDNANQIKEVMGIHTRYIDSIIPVSNSMLTNFNPIIHTLLLGNLFKFGYIIGNVNFGLFLYSLFQLIIVISTYSYVLSYSIKKNINPLYAFISLLFLGIVPLFGFYSITAVKDTLYTCFVVLFSLKIYDIVNKEKYNIKDYLSLLIISLLVCLFRNNGLILVIITLFFVIYKSKKFLITLLLVLIIMISFNKIILPMCGISGTSIREALSIPFQTTARLVKYHDNDIDESDKKVIDKILDYDNMKKDYRKNLADPVKNKFNKYYQKEDIVNYFYVFNKYLWKYPSTYFDAWVNTISSYFYPFENSWKVYHKLNLKLQKAGFDYHYNNLSRERDILFNLEIVFEISPIGLLLNIGFISWLSILIFIALSKNKKYIFLIPNIVSITFCLLSPANTYYRYIYPSLVLLVTLFPLVKNSIENINVE